VIGSPYIANGKGRLDQKLAAYNKAAAHSPWFVLRDFDHDSACPGHLLDDLIPRQSTGMVLRIAVRTAEAWLIADRERLAAFLSVRTQQIPLQPEKLDRPKRALVDLARLSRSRAIQEDMVPPEGLSVEVGPGYTSRVSEFAARHWDPLRASRNSDSLARCIRALKAIPG
jgi:hypothetical protein